MFYEIIMGGNYIIAEYVYFLCLGMPGFIKSADEFAYSVLSTVIQESSSYNLYNCSRINKHLIAVSVNTWGFFRGIIVNLIYSGRSGKERIISFEMLCGRGEFVSYITTNCGFRTKLRTAEVQ